MKIGFRHQFFVGFLAVGSLLLVATSALSQMNTADIAGVVRDPAGDVVPGATVTALNLETQRKFTTVTDAAGQYLLAELPTGIFTLTVDAQGFKQAFQEQVAAHASERLKQDFALQLGEVGNSVIVQIVPGLLQSESAEVKDLLLNQQVVDLPIKDRQFLELTLLSEGVVNPPGGTRGDSLQQTGKLINILGQRTGHNLFLVDGVSVTDEYFNNVVLNPSPDLIQEVVVDKTDYDAEFGGKSGGVINIITKSGTNHLHGSAYEFVRNNIFDAKNFFDPAGKPTPPFKDNLFGGTLGGPVIKDRTFYFVNYEGVRTRASLAQLFSAPTAAERSGNLSGLVPVATTQLIDPISKQPISGNNLNNDPNFNVNNPATAAAIALLAKVPLPTSAGNSNNLLSVGGQSIDTNQYNARIDHGFTERDNASVRASVFDAEEADPFGSSVLNEALLPGFGRTLRTHSDSFAAAETHTFSSNLVNEFRFGWLAVSGGQGNPNAGNPFSSNYGLQGVTTNPPDVGYPQVSLSNTFTTIGDAAGITSRTDRNFEVYDNVLIHHGSHGIRFGGYFFHLNFNPSYPNDARGIYTYGTTYSGNPLADFLLGYPSQAQVGIGEGTENAHTSWAQFYADDEWQFKPTLKIEAGLRYEYNANLVAQSNQTSDIDLTAPGGPSFVVAGDPTNLPATASTLAKFSPLPIVSASSVGWDNSLLTPRYLRFSPRLGIAWSLPQQTVLRAGAGIYTNQAAYSILQNLAENMPFFLVKTVSNATGTPTFTTENILANNPTGTIGANSVNHNYQIEYNEVWNVTAQHALNANTSIEVEYVGSRTVHADSSTTVNVPLPGPGAVQARRPYPNLAAFTTIRWDGWATFNGLTVKAKRRFARGLSFDAEYTLSKSMDDASDTGTTNAEYNLPQDNDDPAAERGPSSFDHRNRFTANAVYDIPFARGTHGLLHAAAASWRASGILMIQSGFPFTVNLSSGQDIANIGLVSGNNVERPNLVGDPNSGPNTPGAWFNTSAFALPAQFTFGSAGRNDVVGPGYEDLDLSLQKEWTARENLTLQFRFDDFNALNHPNFNLPGRIFGAANFGVISSALDPRELQFGLKLLF